jgi:PAB-dependent poly(A)-specific ribonuclease subunit 2
VYERAAETSHFSTSFEHFLGSGAESESEYIDVGGVLNDNRYGISTVKFDTQEELIWTANQGGHVTSYYIGAMGLQKYTSFQVHANEMVNQLHTMDSGILALTNTTLRHQIRRGIPKLTLCSPNMKNLICMLELPRNRLILGGHQNELIDLDLNTFQETQIVRATFYVNPS